MADSDYGAEDGETGGGLMNYKGIYFNDDPNSKYTDPETGAHFEYRDMVARLSQVLKWRRAMEKQIMNSLLPKGQQRALQADENDRAGSKEREAQLRFEKEEFMRKMGKLKATREKAELTKEGKSSTQVTLGDKAPAGQKIVLKPSQVMPLPQGLGAVGKGASNK